MDFQYKELEENEKRRVQQEIYITSLEIKVEKLNSKLERYKEIPEKEDFEIEKPLDIEGIRKEIINIDDTAKNILIEYIRADAYEIVRNTLKVANSSNTVELLAYRNGAISRCEAWIKILENSRTRKVLNRMTGETL